MQRYSRIVLYEIFTPFAYTIKPSRFRSINISWFLSLLSFSSIFLSLSSAFSYATSCTASALQMHIISIIICGAFRVFVKVVSSSEWRTVGETHEILIINSMKLWQIEIKLRSNRFSRAIARALPMRARDVHADARAFSILLRIRTCMSYAGINIRVISRSSYRNEIVNEDGLANSDFTLQWIDNETIEHLPTEAYHAILFRGAISEIFKQQKIRIEAFRH